MQYAADIGKRKPQKKKKHALKKQFHDDEHEGGKKN